MAVITVSRQMGAGGSYIAAQVAKRLGYELVDSTRILKVAENAGVNIGHALSHDEYYESIAYRWLKSIITPNLGKIIVEEKKHLQPVSFRVILTEIIIELAEKNNIIIVGRAGQSILKNKDNVFKVQIIAEMDTRVQRLMQKDGISQKEALKKIKNSDEMRTKYNFQYYNTNKNDPLLYHMTINTTYLGLDEASMNICDAVQRFDTLREYIPGVKDRRKYGDRRRTVKRRMDRRQMNIFRPSDIEALIISGRPFRNYTNPPKRKTDRRQYIRRKEDQQQLLKKQVNS